MNLTIATIRDYSSVQVLKKPHVADSPAPDSRGFFTSIVSKWPSVGLIKYLSNQGIRQPSTCGFEPSAALSKGAKFKISCRSPIMDAQATITPPRRTRKSKSIPAAPNVVANIVFISPELRKEQGLVDWNKAFRTYMDTLSNDETTLVKKCLAFVCATPRNRGYLNGPCPVIQFKSRSKSNAN